MHASTYCFVETGCFCLNQNCAPLFPSCCLFWVQVKVMEKYKPITVDRWYVTEMITFTYIKWIRATKYNIISNVNDIVLLICIEGMTYNYIVTCTVKCRSLIHTETNTFTYIKCVRGTKHNIFSHINDMVLLIYTKEMAYNYIGTCTSKCKSLICYGNNHIHLH